MTISKAYRLLCSVIPTLIFNIRYFGIKKGLRLPVIVSGQVWLKNLGGTVLLPKNPAFAGIKIGFQDVGIFDSKKSRSIWDVKGQVEFYGNCDLGHGTKISVAVTGHLILGNDVRVTAESTFVCRKKITLADGCLVSWEVLFMDTDFHEIIDGHGQRINDDKEIFLGQRVWVGCRSTILKGVRLANNTIVAAGTVVHKSAEIPNQVIGGGMVRSLKKDVTWRI